MNALEAEAIHDDDRRKITQLFTAPVGQVNLYHCKRGSVLGNHYHRETIEYFYVVRGTLLYNGERIFETGDMFVVYPEEKHTIKCMTELTLMTFLSKPYSEEDKDTWTS